MNLPDDFGMSAIQTLAHVADPTPAPSHSAFWNHWHATVWAEEPRLVSRAAPDPSDPGATEEFLSVRHVRIGCRLIEPPGGLRSARAGCVVLHGYSMVPSLAADAERWESAAARGLAVLLVRVRGYAGSRVDCGPLSLHETGYISLGLDAPQHKPEDAMVWVLPQAVADAANACRALRTRLGGEHPVFLSGESFGAGLAVLAAAGLSSHGSGEFEPARLALGLPTLGDWLWRHERVLSVMVLRGGADRSTINGQIADLLARSGPARERVLSTLRLCDAALAATKVRSPTLCKLALRDELVPAPAAAAVYNALATAPGVKWRFLTPYGHFEGGLKNARRHELFRRCVDDFLDPSRSPMDAMATWAGLMSSGNRAPAAAEPAAQDGSRAVPQPGLFGVEAPPPREDEARIIEAYARTGRTLDDLPYTRDFEAMHAELRGAGVELSAAELFRRLHTIRKAGRLPRTGRAQGKPAKVTLEDESLLGSMVTELVGTMGQRDQLPFTPAFDSLVSSFNARTGRQLDPHTVWRLVAKIAK